MSSIRHHGASLLVARREGNGITFYSGLKDLIPPWCFAIGLYMNPRIILGKGLISIAKLVSGLIPTCDSKSADTQPRIRKDGPVMPQI